MSKKNQVRKLLSDNDLGLTGSHQAGIHIPKSLLWFFPQLNGQILNPDCMLEIETKMGARFLSRFIYYNNRLVTESGTRNEHRLTRIVPALRSLGARPGDWLQFTRLDDSRYQIEIVLSGPQTGSNITITVSSGWQVVDYAE